MSSSLTTDESVATSAPRLGRRLRVLEMIGFLSDFGGAERLALGLATHLPRDRFETWVCAPRGADADSAAALREAGVRLVDLGRRRKLDMHRNSTLIGLLRRHRFDIIHSHMFGSNLWASVLGRMCGVPVRIAHEQTWSYENDPLRVWLDGHVIGKLSTRFVAVSSADARRMVTVEGVAPEKVVLIPNAYVPHGTSADIDLRRDLGISREAPLIVTAVVMRPQKALEVLVEAHARLVARVPDVHLVLAGDGPCRPNLERRARELGIESQVHFLGLRNDVDSIIRAADVAAMSSDFEGTPLFAFECMANGTPLVATEVGGLPDIIRNGQTGVLVPRRDPERLADALRSLIARPALRAQLSEAASQAVLPYTIDNITQRFASLYESLVVEASARG